jgi:hypothetical protein
MLEILNTKVYDLRECVIASGYAMTTKPADYDSEEAFQKGLVRMRRLVNASKNSDVKCHHNAITGIRVSFDIKYPQYISPELQRYHWIDIVTSQSKMHRLLKMDINKSCNKFVSQSQVNTLQKDIDLWNKIDSENIERYTFNLRNGEKIEAETHQDCLFYAWMCCISDCPMGLELIMRVSTNYMQLQTIYKQRRHHKLKLDWGPFCDWIEKLPYFKTLFLGEED